MILPCGGLLVASSSQTTTDTTSLTFSFTVQSGVTAISFNWMFGTEEYPDQNVTDIAGVWVDGTNVLEFSNSSIVRYVMGTNDSFFTNNNQDHTGGSSPLSIEYDAITAPATVMAGLDTSLSTHTIKIAVSDTTDTVMDSGLFIGDFATGSGSGFSINDVTVSERAMSRSMLKSPWRALLVEAMRPWLAGQDP